MGLGPGTWIHATAHFSSSEASGSTGPPVAELSAMWVVGEPMSVGASKRWAHGPCLMGFSPALDHSRHDRTIVRVPLEPPLRSFHSEFMAQP